MRDWGWGWGSAAWAGKRRGEARGSTTQGVTEGSGSSHRLVGAVANRVLELNIEVPPHPTPWHLLPPPGGFGGVQFLLEEKIPPMVKP